MRGTDMRYGQAAELAQLRKTRIIGDAMAGKKKKSESKDLWRPPSRTANFALPIWKNSNAIHTPFVSILTLQLRILSFSSFKSHSLSAYVSLYIKISRTK